MQELSYRTYDSLMASVEGSLRKYADNNLIIRQNYIKIARTVNSDLGIKINKIEEVILDVENYRATLPSNLLSIIVALIVIDPTCCQYPRDIIREWQYSSGKCDMLCPTSKSLRFFNKNSMNRWCRNPQYQVDVQERDLKFNFEKGKVYVGYVCDMADEDDNLLVLDHPLVNPYYESAIRAEILKDLWYNIDADTQRKYENERDIVLPKVQKKAISIVTFPGYRKMKENAQRIEQEFFNKWVKNI